MNALGLTAVILGSATIITTAFVGAIMSPLAFRSTSWVLRTLGIAVCADDVFPDIEKRPPSRDWALGVRSADGAVCSALHSEATDDGRVQRTEEDLPKADNTSPDCAPEFHYL